MWIKQFIVLVLSLTAIQCETYTFPQGFQIGSGSSAYQIEGAWNEDGKSDSIWDKFSNSNNNGIRDHSNGKVATDSYRKYEDDVKALKEVGVSVQIFLCSIK